MNDRFLRRREVLARTGLSNTTIWRLERDGSFPQRCQISPGLVGWRESDVSAWIDERPAASDSEAA